MQLLLRQKEGNDVRIKRIKNIVIEDSYRTFNCVKFDRTSSILTGRNPFKQDHEAIDYDMDSEDEEAEANGEDLDNDQNNAEEEDDSSNSDEES